MSLVNNFFPFIYSVYRVFFKPNIHVELLGDLNARVGIVRTEGVVGMHGVSGRNENKERMTGFYGEWEMVAGKTVYTQAISQSFSNDF